MGDSIEKLGDILGNIVSGSALSKGLKEQEALRIWPEIVGEKIARHSSVIALKDGILLVQVESSVWAQELSLLKPRIREALEDKLGEGKVRDIRFHSGNF